MPSLNYITTQFSKLLSSKKHEPAPKVDEASKIDPKLRGDTTNNTLINIQKLSGLSAKDIEMFTAVNKAVIDYMASPKYKDGCGYAHV